ncbi:MAG TPA: AAA family ATPase, partial [Gemmatimonadaceae bacterium]|nr:AAA family ATPase [Gemmatimonadaceae bacterium]
MYLKRLDVHGFKSFATRTTLEFGQGITAIVGPNGSGKSNIADALRWVLGEQSGRLLRAKKLDDIIFAGSSTRQRSDRVEVTLTLDNSDGWLPVDVPEVAAARRG